MLPALLLLALSLPDQASFKPLFKNSDMSITLAKSPKEPWVEATHTLPIEGNKLFELLTDFSKYESVFAGSVKSVKILEAGPGFVRLHIVWPLPFPMRNRDAVVKYTFKKAPEKFLIEWNSDPKKGDPEEGLRIDDVAGQTVIAALNQTEPSGSNLTYTYYADLGGNLPSFIKEGSYTEEPLVYFNAIRKHFALPPITSK